MMPYMIMGMLGGPLLGVFLLGMLSRRANSTGSLLGAFFGSVALAYIVFATKVSFLWYAAFGCLATMLLGYLFSLATGPTPKESTEGLVFDARSWRATDEDDALSNGWGRTTRRRPRRVARSARCPWTRCAAGWECCLRRCGSGTGWRSAPVAWSAGRRVGIALVEIPAAYALMMAGAVRLCRRWLCPAARRR